MSRGRPRKTPTELKLEGTYRADRHGTRRDPTDNGGVIPPTPDDLTPDAAELWQSVTLSRGDWLSSSDASSLRLLCDSWGNLRACQRLLAENPTDREARIAWASYAGVYNRLAPAFGLTPTTRAALGEAVEGNPEDREMLELLA